MCLSFLSSPGWAGDPTQSSINEDSCTGTNYPVACQVPCNAGW